MPPQAPPTPAEPTRLALIRAGLDRFGAKGFEAASTREIAAAAKANIAAIAYYFGGKEGLRKACAEHIATLIQGVLGPVVEQFGATELASPEEAEARLAQAIDAMIAFIVMRPDAQAFARFVLREQMEQSPAFDIIYESTFAPMHVRVCQLWARATGAPANSEETRLSTFAVIAQIVYFRIARFVVLRRMDWPDIGPREAEKISQTIKSNLRAAIRAEREKRQ